MNKLLNEFRNYVCCRREANQHNAKIIWKQISHNINESDKRLFETEWSHYMNNELTTDEFMGYFNKILSDEQHSDKPLSLYQIQSIGRTNRDNKINN